MKITWRQDKDRINRRKHGYSLSEAATVFADPLAAVTSDEEHSAKENRFKIIGMSCLGHLLRVSYTYTREDGIHLITARKPSRTERKDYEKQQY
jgi:uncharacterized DUF497 family protein